MFNFKNNLIMKIIQNNSGYSVKSFFLLSVTILCCFLIATPILVIFTELWFTHTTSMSWSDIAAYIAAVFSGATGAGIVKAWSEKYERHPGPDGKLGTEDDIYIKREQFPTKD